MQIRDVLARDVLARDVLARDVLARDEPTRTCCGPLPSWKTLEKIKNIDFNFENQD